MATITLVTGGTRSGKSFLAMQKALSHSGNRLFFATATACDEEMEARILKHQNERGDDFATVETPYDLAYALVTYATSDISVILIDCLTVWVGNLMYKYGDNTLKINEIIGMFCKALAETPVDCVVVTNEVGMGIVPENRMAREFRDLAGVVNRQVATIASEVVMSVCGIPLKIK